MRARGVYGRDAHGARGAAGVVGATGASPPGRFA